MIMAAETILRPTSNAFESVSADGPRLDLLYLEWERRQYGRHPVPVSSGFGWQYVLIIRGEPTLLFEDGQRKLRPGHLLIISPGCATGWADRLTRVQSYWSGFGARGHAARNAPQHRACIDNGSRTGDSGTDCSSFTRGVEKKSSEWTN